MKFVALITILFFAACSPKENGSSVVSTTTPTASASKSSITAGASTVADGVAIHTVTVKLKTSSGVAVVGVVPTISIGGSGNTNAGCFATDSTGTGICAIKSTKAEAKVLRLLTPVDVTGNSALFVAGPVSASKSTIDSTVSSVVADGVAVATIKATILDAFSNPVSGQVPTFSATGTGASNVYSTCSVSDGAGYSYCTLKSTKAEVKTLQLLTPVAATGTTVSFIAGVAVIANSSIVGSGPVFADGTASSTITITLQDAFLNPVKSIVPTFNATNTGNTNSYGSCSVTNASGVSICSLASSTPELKTLSLVTPIAKSDGTVSFYNYTASPLASTISGTGPVVADGVATSTVTITLKDAGGTPIAGQTPTFSATNTGTTNVYGACSVTNASGVSTCSLKSLKAESKTLQILTPTSVTGATPVVFIAGSPSAATTTISGTSPVVADGATSSVITVTIKDAQGNPVSGQTPTFSATDTNSTNIYGACNSSDASGISTCTLKSLKAESKTLQLLTPVSVAGAAPVVFTASGPSAAQSTISGTEPVVADGVATSTITITLKDTNANPISGLTPTFSATDTGTVNVYSACSVTNASGVSTCTLKSTKAESKTLNLTSPIALTSAAPVSFVPGAVSSSTTTIAGTGPVLANGTASSTITVTLLDAYSNPVSGQTPTFTATDTGTTNAYGACSSSNSSGLSTCTLKSTKAESKTLQLTAPVSVSGPTAVVFTAGGADPSQSSIVGTGPVVADGVATSTVNITLKDANANPVTGATPVFNATDTGATNAYSACSVTDSSGVSTCTIKSTKAESKTLNLTSPISLSSVTPVSFVAGAASSATTTISGTSPVLANGTAASVVTITLLDAFSNPIAGQTPAFAATDTGSTNVYGACSSSNSSGVSTCTLKSTKAETKTLSLSSPVSMSGGTVSFVPDSVSATYTTIVGSGPVVANGVASSTITITLKDANDNAVPGLTPTFSATDTGTTNNYGVCSSSDASGVSNCTLSSTKAEVKTLQLTAPISKTDGTVSFVAGSASSSTSTIVGTTPVVADGSATSTITVTLLDAYSNPVSGQTPIFNATDTGTTNTYGACSASNASGVSTCTLKSTKAEVKTLQMTSPVAVTGATVTFVAGSASALTTTISGTTPVVANGTSTSTITVTIQDAYGNAISGATPTFSATNTGSTNSYGACSSSNSSGVATCTLSSTYAESKVLQLATPVVVTGNTVVFSAGAAVVANSTILGSGPVVADGTATSTVTITLKDVYNNLVAGVTPTFTATDTGTTNTYGSCSASNSSGVSTCTLASTKAEVKTLQLTAPVSLTGGTVTFTAGSALAANCSITGTSPVTADGASTSTVTITLKDAYNNLISGTTPTFTATDTGSTNSYGACSASNASGVSTCTLASTKAEVKTLQIATPVSKSGGTVTFSPGAMSTSTSSVTACAGPLIGNGTDSCSVTIVLKDAFSNPLVGQTPVMVATDTGSQNSYGACTAADSTGTATCSFTTMYAETKTVSITSPAALTGNTVVFNSRGLDLIVPIEMIHYGISSNTTAVTFERSRTSLNTTDYNGTVSYSFEIVGLNTNATTPYNITLIDNAGATKATITIAPGNTLIRDSVSFTPTSGANVYRLKLDATAAANNLAIYAARIKVKQIAATQTKIYIPLVADTFNVTSNSATTQVDQSASTTLTQATADNFVLWQRNDSAYATIAAGSPWTFEIVGRSNNAAGVLTASLVQAGTTTAVTGADLTVTGTTVTLTSASFAGNAANFASGTSYEVKYKSNNASYTSQIFKAGIWIKLTNLTKAEIWSKVAGYRTGTTSATMPQQKTLLDLASHSFPKAYFEATAKNGTANGGTAQLYTDATTDTGLAAAATVVTGSTVTPSGTTRQRIRSAQITTLVDGDRLVGRHNRTAGTAVISAGFLVLTIDQY